MTDSTIPNPEATVATPQRAPLPAIGETFNGRTVRATGTMPYSGADFAVFRHNARAELRASGSARKAAKAAGEDSPEQIGAWTAATLLSLICEVRAAGGGEWRRLNPDDILDLDAEDFGALSDTASGLVESDGTEGDAANPPSPTT